MDETIRATPAPVLASPICAELRSKKYYFLERAPMSSEEVLDASNDCWCAVSHDRIGPDLESVHPDICRAARKCFKSIYAGATPPSA
jgi:hypothetical protein